jgi:hypothetical protein
MVMRPLKLHPNRLTSASGNLYGHNERPRLPPPACNRALLSCRRHTFLTASLHLHKHVELALTLRQLLVQLLSNADPIHCLQNSKVVNQHLLDFVALQVPHKVPTYIAGKLANLFAVPSRSSRPVLQRSFHRNLCNPLHRCS